MIEVFKIVKGLVRLDINIFFKKSDTALRGHNEKFFKPRNRLPARNTIFSRRTINDWNGLPQTVIDAPNVNIFKNRLDVHWSGERYKFLERGQFNRI